LKKEAIGRDAKRNSLEKNVQEAESPTPEPPVEVKEGKGGNFQKSVSCGGPMASKADRGSDLKGLKGKVQGQKRDPSRRGTGMQEKKKVGRLKGV